MFESQFIASGLRTTSEERSLRGRTDLTVFAGKHIYVLEFKYGETAAAALAQIHAKGYYRRHLGTGHLVHLLGFNAPKDGKGEPEWSKEEIKS